MFSLYTEILIHIRHFSYTSENWVWSQKDFEKVMKISCQCYKRLLRLNTTFRYSSPVFDLYPLLCFLIYRQDIDLLFNS